MAMPNEEMGNWKPRKPLAIGIDSDGCVMDVMDRKHRDCFARAWIDVFELQAVSQAAMEVWLYVNLFSSSRGVNRFKAAASALELLADHPAVRHSGFVVDRHPEIADWVGREPKLGMPALEAAIEQDGSESLKQLRAWSHEVNRLVGQMDQEGGPFAGAAAGVRAAAAAADVLVISQAPRQTLLDEWSRHGLAELVSLVAGQELGPKSRQLADTCCRHLTPNRCLMLGDAPGDREAAKATGVHFFPIIPGHETESWQAFVGQILPLFASGSLHVGHLRPWHERFEAVLPDRPPWLERIG